MKLHLLLIPTTACMLFSCHLSPLSFVPQRAPFREKSLAWKNRIPADDLYVEVCSQKAYYVTIEFKSIPPDGCFKLNSSIRYGDSSKPRFIHIKVPGGDVTNLLAEPECASITKTGNEPILCRPLPTGKASQNNYSLTLKNFSSEDLLAIAPNIPEGKNHRIIELDPADGIVDWAVIARFPARIGWRFRNVKKWLNADTSNVSSDFFVFYSGCLELPAQFSVNRIYIDREVDVPEQVRQMLMNKAKNHVLPEDFSDSEWFEF